MRAAWNEDDGLQLDAVAHRNHFLTLGVVEALHPRLEGRRHLAGQSLLRQGGCGQSDQQRPRNRDRPAARRLNDDIGELQKRKGWFLEREYCGIKLPRATALPARLPAERAVSRPTISPLRVFLGRARRPGLREEGVLAVARGRGHDQTRRTPKAGQEGRRMNSLSFTVSDGVATLALQRSACSNAIDITVIRAIHLALDQIQKGEGGAKAVVHHRQQRCLLQRTRPSFH